MEMVRFLWVVLLLASFLAGQERPAKPATLVQQLKSDKPSVRQTARDALIALGADAVGPLTDVLPGVVPSKLEPEFAKRALEILGALGPRGVEAVPALLAAAETIDLSILVDLLTAIANLAPYCPEGVEMASIHKGLLRRQRQQDIDVIVAVHRLGVRGAFPRKPDLELLIAALDGYRPYRVEVAIERLGHRASAARSAIPGLLKILDQPNPRIPRSDDRVLLREAAARAILAIAPEGVAATRAKTVLEGEQVPAPAPIPERARVRISELIKDLGASDREVAQAAGKNLQAYGKVAVPAIAGALRNLTSEVSRSTALSVLRGLGSDGAASTPALYLVLTEYPSVHTAEIFEALAAVGPWSRDVLFPVWYGYSVGRLDIFGTRIQGDAGVDIINSVTPAAHRCWIVTSIDVGCTVAELEQMLADRNVQKREQALRILRHHGTAARAVLPAVLAAMREPHPKAGYTRWKKDGGVRTGPVSRDDEVHRLAAETILAIAPQDAAETREAKQVLAKLKEKK